MRRGTATANSKINLPTAIKALEQGGKDFPHLKEMAKSATLSMDVFKSYTQKRDEMTMSEFMKMCEALDKIARFPGYRASGETTRKLFSRSFQ